MKNTLRLLKLTIYDKSLVGEVEHQVLITKDIVAKDLLTELLMRKTKRLANESVNLQTRIIQVNKRNLSGKRYRIRYPRFPERKLEKGRN